jgi:hypothetical protein
MVLAILVDLDQPTLYQTCLVLEAVATGFGKSSLCFSESFSHVGIKKTMAY